MNAYREIVSDIAFRVMLGHNDEQAQHLGLLVRVTHTSFVTTVGENHLCPQTVDLQAFIPDNNSNGRVHTQSHK